MSIYDQIGGAGAVGAAVELFYEKVTGDPQLADYFDGVDMVRLKGHQRAFIGAALGGSEVYRGRDMAAAHASLGITDTQFDSVVAHLADTLSELGVTQEIIGQIGEALGPLRSEIVAAPQVI